MTSHKIMGVLGLTPDTEVKIAIVVLHDTEANNYEIWRVQGEAVAELVSDIDEWNVAGLNVRGANFGNYADTAKYADEFMTEPSAIKYAKREAEGFATSHGLVPLPGFGHDAALVKPDPAAAALQQTVSKHPSNPHTPTRKGRFDDDDDSFGSRFTRAKAKADHKRRMAELPDPAELGTLVANDDAMPAPIRLENPVSKKGGKFWEASVVNEERIDAPNRDWHVIVRFGALVDERNGSSCNEKRVASYRSKGAALAERSKRVQKQLTKRNNMVGTPNPDNYYRQVAR